jgi:hypothetical protein
MTDQSSPAVVRELLAGIGMGLLVGILLGMAMADVVGGALAAMTALLAAFLGLGGVPVKSNPEVVQASQNALRGWRAAGFGLACFAAILGGVHIRAHNALGRTPAELVKSWTDAGYTLESARELVAFQETGIVPKGAQAIKPERVAGRTSSALFTAEQDSNCGAFEASRFPSAAKRLDAFTAAGGVWSELARSARGLEPQTQAAVLSAGWRMRCETQ